MVGVDKPRKQHQTARIKHNINPRLSAGRNTLDDPVTTHDESSRRAPVAGQRLNGHRIKHGKRIT
jgi:hypothetical protein